MKRPKVTPWFPANVRPKHLGVYETRDDYSGIYYAHWNGYFWGWRCWTIQNALERRQQQSSHVVHSWRGLIRKPK